MSYTPFNLGQYNATPPTISDGGYAALQLDVNGNLKTTVVGSGGLVGINLEQGSGVDLAQATPYGTPPGGTSTPAFVKSGNAAAASGSSTITVNFSSNVSSGNVILVAIGWDGNDDNTVPTVSDPTNGTYSLVQKVLNTSGSPGGSLTSIAIFAVTATATGNPTISVVMHARGAAVPLEYSGLSTSLDQYATANQTTSSTTMTSGTLTTTHSIELLLSVSAIITNSTTATAGSGYTMEYQANAIGSGLVSLLIQDQVVSVTGTYSASVSGISPSQFSSMLLVSIPAFTAVSNVIGVNAYVTNAISATNSANGVPGSAVPSDATFIGGTDGTDLRGLLCDASGRLAIIGAGASGSAVTGNPVLVAGSDGTNARTLATDTSGRQTVVGAAASGSALAGNPVLVAGSDGTNARDIATDSSGNVKTVAQAGTAIIGKVGIDQTTPGTTNGVQVNAALPAGTNLIGKVGIDQTTPGTTNAVQDASDGPVTAGTAAGKSSLAAGVAATSAPSVSAGQQIAIQLDSKGNQRVSPYGQTGSFTSSKTTGSGASAPQISVTVPASTKWRLKSSNVSLTTSGTAGNRSILLIVTDSSGNQIAGAAAGLTLAASSVANFIFAPSVPTLAAFPSGSANATVGYPELSLGPGFVVSVYIINAAAGDTMSLAMNIESYPD